VNTVRDMPTELSKSILEIDDLQGISPNFDQLKIIPQETAQKIETLIFAKDKTTLKVLTTNNVPDGLTSLLKSLEDK